MLFVPEEVISGHSRIVVLGNSDCIEHWKNYEAEVQNCPDALSRMELNRRNIAARKVTRQQHQRVRNKALVGLICVYGKVRNNLQQYQVLGAVLRSVFSKSIAPSGTCLRQSIVPLYITNLFVADHIRV